MRVYYNFGAGPMAYVDKLDHVLESPHGLFGGSGVALTSLHHKKRW